MKTRELIEAEEKSILSLFGVLADISPSGLNAPLSNLTSLKGSPRIIKGYFHCGSNKLETLKGGPDEVEDSFIANNNQLLSLEGGPSKVGGSYFCSMNKLFSLKGAPKEVGSMGRIDGDFDCSENYISSLEHCPSVVVGNLMFQQNELTSLKGIHKQIHSIGGFADFSRNPITSHVLGLIRIKGLTSVSLSNRKVEIIINSCIGKKIDIFTCQERLISAGFEDFAQL